jgi:beta-lactamase regulating signal transducer with metallopeptidase domain
MHWIDPIWASAISSTLIHSLWQGASIAVLIFVISKSGLLKHDQQHYWMYILGMLLTFSCTMFTFFYLYTSVDSSGAVIPVYETGLLTFTPHLDYDPGPFSWSIILTGLWSVGIFIYLIKMGVGYIKMWKVVRDATSVSDFWYKKLDSLKCRMGGKSHVRLKSSHDVGIPFIWGVTRPVIIIPVMYFTRLNPKEIEGILLHELAHIKKYDFLLNIIQLLVESLFFYHPIIWWFSYRARMFREYRCDALVTRHTEDINTYLQALYHAARISFDASNTKVALLNNQSQLIMRIKRMTTRQAVNNRIKPMISLILILLFGFTFLAFSTMWKPSKGIEQKSMDFLPGKTFTPGVFKTEPSINALLPDYNKTISNTIPHTINNKINGNDVSVVTLPEFDKPDNKVDTVPDQEKLLLLEKQLQEKESDLAQMEHKMQASLNDKLEQSQKSLEDMQRKMELAHQKLALDEERHKKMDALSRMEEKLAQRMEEINNMVKDEIESGTLRKHELEMEKKAIEIEELRLNGDLEKVQAKEKELQMLSLEMRKKMLQLKEKQLEMMNDPELKKAKEQLQNQRKLLKEEEKSRMKKMQFESQQMQSKMYDIRRDMELQMEAAKNEMMDAHKEKENEVRALKEALDKERSKN